MATIPSSSLSSQQKLLLKKCEVSYLRSFQSLFSKKIKLGIAYKRQCAELALLTAEEKHKELFEAASCIYGHKEANIKVKLEEVKKEINALRQVQIENTKLADENGNLKAIIAELEKNYNDLKAKNESLTNNAVDHVSQEITKHNEELQKTVDEQTKHINTISEKHDVISAQHKIISAEHKDLQDKHEVLTNKHEKLTTSHDELEGANNSLKNENANLNTTIANQTEEIAAKTSILNTEIKTKLVNDIELMCFRIDKEVATWKDQNDHKPGGEQVKRIEEAAKEVKNFYKSVQKVMENKPYEEIRTLLNNKDRFERPYKDMQSYVEVEKQRILRKLKDDRLKTPVFKLFAPNYTADAFCDPNNKLPNSTDPELYLIYLKDIFKADTTSVSYFEVNGTTDKALASGPSQAWRAWKNKQPK